MSNLLSVYLDNCREFAQNHLPQACLLCGARAVGSLLCVACNAGLPSLPAPRCTQCALPLAAPGHDAGGGTLCGRCLRHPPAFTRTVAALAYAFPLDALIRHCKYGGALALTDWFAGRLAQALDGAPRPDLILPMPLHEARLAGRGFNQAAEIARRLSSRLGVPWWARGCSRTRDTPPQAGLDLRSRRRNLRGAFHCNQDLEGRHVALLDDVMTSGASLDELARAVRAAGAAEVSAWVVARTLR